MKRVKYLLLCLGVAGLMTACGKTAETAEEVTTVEEVTSEAASTEETTTVEEATSEEASTVEEDVDDATHNYQQIVALGLNEADAQAAPAPAPAPEPTPAPAPETTNNGGNDEFIPVYGEQPGLGYGGTY